MGTKDAPVKVSTDGDDFVTLLCGGLSVEFSKDGDSPNCPNSWTYASWLDGEFITGECEEMAFSEAIESAAEAFGEIAEMFDDMREYLTSCKAFTIAR